MTELNTGTWNSMGLALTPMAGLIGQQDGERRCVRLAVTYGLPVEEGCAATVDRIQDEIDRRLDDPRYAGIGYTVPPVRALGYEPTFPWHHPTP